MGISVEIKVVFCSASLQPKETSEQVCYSSHYSVYKAHSDLHVQFWSVIPILGSFWGHEAVTQGADGTSHARHCRSPCGHIDSILIATNCQIFLKLKETV